MTIESVDRVAVLGAGTMGHGIAEVAAIAGYGVTMRDVESDLIEDGSRNIEWSLEKLAENGRLDDPVAEILARIETTTDLEAAVADADLVIEAAPEDLALKRDVFADLEAYTGAETMLATNTSSLPITDIAAAVDAPERVLGLHFFNPPVKMDLVEVVSGEETGDAVVETGAEWVESIGKTPIRVRKDVRGFVVNTVLGPFIGEPAWMVSNGEATVRQADAAMVHRRGYPMGSFELADLTGIDVSYRVREEAGDPIPPIIEEKVADGDLGRKTGAGYYDYEDGGASGTSRADGEGDEGGEGPDYEPGDGEGFDALRVEARMIDRAAFLVGDDVATPEAIDTGVRLGLGFPEGICRRADEIGLETVLEKLETLHAETGADRFDPHPHLRELADSGTTGTDTGSGFYECDSE